MIMGVFSNLGNIKNLIVARLFMSTMFLIVIASLLLSCIKVGPDYETLETKMPDEWYETITYGLNEGTANLETWWTVFNDPILNDLISEAHEGNLDLKQAAERVIQARTQVKFTVGDYFPIVQGQGSIEKSRESEGLSLSVPPPQTRTDTFFDLGGAASWEIDLWGRIARSVESAEASDEASVESYRDTLVVLFSEVASNYILVRTLQSQIKIAYQNIELQKKTLKLTQDRFKAGISPLLDVRQAELNLATTESTVPNLVTSLEQAINRIGVLLGDYPSSLHAELSKPYPIPKPPHDVAIGLPAELLRQRPDIRQAEREVAAQTAQIGVATADLFPQFSLFGTIALEAVDSVSFFSSSNLTFGLGPQVVWNIFQGGQLRYNIEIQKSITEELFLNYKNIVLQALEEVENAMVAYVQEINRLKSLERSVVAAQSAVDLVETLYKSGLTDFQNVLDSQRSLFQQEDQLVESRGDVLQDLVSLYQALGGGWSPGSDEYLYSKESTKKLEYSPEIEKNKLAKSKGDVD